MEITTCRPVQDCLAKEKMFPFKDIIFMTFFHCIHTHTSSKCIGGDTLFDVSALDLVLYLSIQVKGKEFCLGRLKSRGSEEGL